MSLKQIFSDVAPDGSQRLDFWHPDLKQARKAWFKLTLLCFVLVTICTFLLQSFYFGSYYRLEENAYRLTCRIIDLDSEANPTGALVGPALRQASQQNIAANPNFHLGWQIEENLGRFALTGNGLPEGVSQRGIDADEYARDIVLDQDVFGAIVVHANATSAATQAAQNGVADYSPLGAMSFYYSEARNFFSTGLFYTPYVTQLMEAAAAQAAQEFAARQLQAAVTGATLNATALQAFIAPPATPQPGFSGSLLTKPFSYSQFNLRPFDQLVGTAATTVGQIYLIIFTFYVGLGFKQAFDPLAPKLRLGSEVLVRLAVPFIGYFWISLNYSLVTLAFQVDFTRKYGIGGFPLFWGINFVSMLGLGWIMEASLATFGLLGFPFFLLAWVIINVSVAFFDIASLDHFYSYGFVMPVWNSVDTAKSVIFATKNHLGQNFAVNIAWVFFGATCVSFLAVFKRKHAERQEEKQEAAKREEEQSSSSPPTKSQ